MAIVTQTIGTTGRDYSTLILWEQDLDNAGIYNSSDDAVGESYDDSDFSDNLVINGGGTVGLATITLTVASGERHDGTVLSGGVINNPSSGHPVRVSRSDVTVEWFMLTNQATSSNNAGFFSDNFSNIAFKHNILYDMDSDAAFQRVYGVRQLSSGQQNFICTNNILYNLDQPNGSPSNYAWAYSCLATSVGNPALCYNNIAFNINSTPGSGGTAYNCEGYVRNCVAATVGGDCYLASASPQTESHNLATDNTDAGTGSNGADDGVAVGNLFVSTVGGTEDLHSQDIDADQVDSGVDLGTAGEAHISIATSGFADGYDRDTDTDGRASTWDIGADEFDTAVAAAVAFPFSHTLRRDHLVRR